MYEYGTNFLSKLLAALPTHKITHNYQGGYNDEFCDSDKIEDSEIIWKIRLNHAGSNIQYIIILLTNNLLKDEIEIHFHWNMYSFGFSQSGYKTDRQLW